MDFRVQQYLLFVQAPTPNSEEETIFFEDDGNDEER